MILSENIPDSVKSSGTVLEEPSCTILSPNILDKIKVDNRFEMCYFIATLFG